MLIQLNTFLSKKKRLTGIFNGIVKDNMDPEKLGCVRVLIPGVLEPSEDDEEFNSLPWAYPIHPVGGGSVDNQTLRIPNVDANVTVMFNDDNPYTPYYIGSILHTETINETLSADYPTTYGSEDEQGTGWAINRTQKTVTVKHTSGVTFTCDADGNVTINQPGNLSWTVGGDVSLTASGKVDIVGSEINLN